MALSRQYISLDNVSEPAADTKNSVNPLFNCEYTIEKNNKPSKETFIVSLNLLSADFIKNANYDEYKINMEDVCRDSYIRNQHIKSIKEDYAKQNIKLNIEPKGAELSDNTDIYPVFRWVCKYEIQGKQNNGLIKTDTKGLGVYIDDDYCKRKSPPATKATHHDYNDPYSLYCTRPSHDSSHPEQ